MPTRSVSLRNRAWSALPGVVLAALLAGAAPCDAETACDSRRPEQIFTRLEALDSAGEARLSQALKDLSTKEGWSQADWEKYTLALSDDPAVDANEDRRSSLFAQVFEVLGRAPIDCATLDRLEHDILELEQRQWDTALGKVQRRLAGGGST